MFTGFGEPLFTIVAPSLADVVAVTPVSDIFTIDAPVLSAGFAWGSPPVIAPTVVAKITLVTSAGVAVDVVGLLAGVVLGLFDADRLFLLFILFSFFIIFSS
jgi:hypothetical protein